MTFIFLRRYPTMHHLASHFNIGVSTVHRILHQIIKYLHAHLVPKYIVWHTMRQWRDLAGIYPEWPRVVAILDCTPFRISKPTGKEIKVHLQCTKLTKTATADGCILLTLKLYFMKVLFKEYFIEVTDTATFSIGLL